MGVFFDDDDKKNPYDCHLNNNNKGIFVSLCTMVLRLLRHYLKVLAYSLLSYIYAFYSYLDSGIVPCNIFGLYPHYLLYFVSSFLSLFLIVSTPTPPVVLKTRSRRKERERKREREKEREREREVALCLLRPGWWWLFSFTRAYTRAREREKKRDVSLCGCFGRRIPNAF